MKKTFETPDDLLKDPIFIKILAEEVSDLRTKRMERKPAKPGFHYKRDWYDRMTENHQFNREFFLSNLSQIWMGNSKLSSELRIVIRTVGSAAFNKMVKAYAEIEAKENEGEKEIGNNL